MTSAVGSTFDVVEWFYERAMEDGDYIQPMKLQRLLFLAQAYWAVSSRGGRLMPAVFVADKLGPIEPNVHRVLELGRPRMEARPIPKDVLDFLDSVWRKFGVHTAEHLGKMVLGHAPVLAAIRAGVGAEITLDAMHAFYGAAKRQREMGSAAAPPPVEQVVRPRMLRSQSGKAVAVSRWTPGKKASSTKPSP